MKCPHCGSEDMLEPLSEQEAAKVPVIWKLGQVGKNDTIHRCRECKKLAAFGSTSVTASPVGREVFT